MPRLHALARIGLVFKLFVTLGLLGGCAVATQPGNFEPNPADVEVTDRVLIQENAFKPPTIRIHAGTTLTWINDDDTLHTVTSANRAMGVWGSPDLSLNSEYMYTFRIPGTYEYVCKYHPEMTGKVVVVP